MAQFDTHSPLAYSTLVNAPGTAGTSFILQPGEGSRFTANQPVTIWPGGAIPTLGNSEIGRCTVVATDTLTVTRAQEGTTARNAVAGWNIAATITPKSLTDIEIKLYPYRYVDGIQFAQTTAGIQAAIDDLPATGGEVIIQYRGTLSITSTITAVDNLTLVGLGKGVTILQRPVAMANTEFLDASNKDNLHFADFTIDGNSSATKATCTTNSAALRVDGCTTVLIQRMGFTNCSSTGVANQTGVDVTVQDCDFTGSNSGANPSGGTHLEEGVTTAGAGPTNFRVTRCTFRNFRHSGYFGGGAGCEVSYCYISNCHLQTSPTGGGAIAFNQATSGLIHGNVIVGGASATLGIEIDNTDDGLIVTDNLIIGTGAEGIMLQEGFVSGSNNCNVRIQGNTVINCALTAGSRAGINVAANKCGWQILDNRVFNDGTSNSSYGVRVVAGTSNNYIIAGNDLRNCGTAGLLDGGTGTTKQIYGNLPFDANVYKRDYINAAAWLPIEGTPVTGAIGSTANGFDKDSGYAFDAAAAESIVTHWEAPDGLGSNVLFTLRWAPSTTNTGVCYWSLGYAQIDAANQIDEAPSFEHLNQAGAATADAAQELAFAALALTAGAHYKLVVRRWADNASDTYSADAWFLGLRAQFYVGA